MMKLTESLSLHQQQLLVDGVLELACKAGIIKSRSLVTESHLLMLLDDLGEMLTMERQIKYFTSGVIMPQGVGWLTMRDEIDERTGKAREVKTSRVITIPSSNRLDEFETLNTVYRAVPGLTIEDLRVEPDVDE